MPFASPWPVFSSRGARAKPTPRSEYPADLFDRFTVRVDQPLGGIPQGFVIRAKGKSAALFPNTSLQTVVSQGDGVYLIKVGKQHGKAPKATEQEVREA